MATIAQITVETVALFQMAKKKSGMKLMSTLLNDPTIIPLK
ncbi:hypothetical protein J8TS2_33170 [Lederbergia ruris]|uniref:Uncharacterized protein n=1 Tax=Lederbergia ruris TaxID=217495 RepID=A0ABQ4KM41_9BACI|nr:hypothetical protein J8TS2_33170 [Lederbergia ruris]